MDNWGKIINIVFVVLVFFVLGDYFGFIVGVVKEMIFLMIVGKLVGGIIVIFVVIFMVNWMLGKFEIEVK